MDDSHGDAAANDTPEARFGAELRRLRVRAGLSQRDLAAALYRVASTISEFESGRRLPRVEVAEQYEEHFGLPRGTLVRELALARAERLDHPVDGIAGEHLGDAACPYKGLRAFEREDAELFFGREAQVEQVAARLAEVRFVAVVGASGSGKSSFVRAGLLARIGAANGDAPAGVAVLTPGTHPLDALKAAAGAATDVDLPADPDDLGAALRRAAAGGLVIVVDQLEELFTVCRDEAERGGFVAALMAGWRDPTSSVSVILTLRADFYGHLAAYPELAAAVVAHQALIGPMCPYDLGRAIELPAAHAGLQLQAGLVETLLDDVAGEPGGLPLLSHALLETWKRRRRLMLTVGGYREAGGVRGAIAKTAEDVLQSLPEADRPIARAIFLSLTDVAEGAEPGPRRVARADLAVASQGAASVDRVLGILVDARLVTLEERTVVVAHEALIRHWPRLRGWIESERADLLVHRRLGDAARQWDALHRDAGALYRGARHASAREWATDHAGELGPLERDFLAASDAAAQRSTRRLRMLAAGLAAVAAIVATLAVLALAQRDNAREERASAQREAAEATSLALAVSAAEPLATRPDISLGLAFEAYRTAPRAEARSAVVRALSAVRKSRTRDVLPMANVVDDVAFGRDDRLLVLSGGYGYGAGGSGGGLRGGELSHGHDYLIAIASSRDGSTLVTAGAHEVRLWDARTLKPLGRLRDGKRPYKGLEYGSQSEAEAAAAKRPAGPTYSYEAVVFSPDSRLLATAGDDGSVRLWDVATRRLRGRLTGHSGKVTDVAFSRDGETLASAGRDGTVRLWDRATGRQVGLLTGHNGAVRAVAFSPDSKTLATAGADRTARLWEVSTRKQLGRLTGHRGEVRAVAFSPDGGTLATASLDRTARLWDPATRGLLDRLVGHDQGVTDLAFSRDGRTLATASPDQVRLWDPTPPAHLRLDGHITTVGAVAFSPDGRTLASSSPNDATARLWDPKTGKLRARLSGNAGGVEAIAFSPDSKTLVTASGDTVRLWDPATRTERGRLSGPTSGIVAVAFSPDGKTLATGGTDGVLRVWDLATRKQRRAITDFSDAVSMVAFSPDGRAIAVAAGFVEGVAQWDAATGRELEGYGGHDAAIYAIAFSPGGRTLASAGQDGMTLLSRATTRRLAPLPARPVVPGRLTGDAPVQAVAFSPDARTLVTAGDDGMVRLWDPASRTPLGSLAGHAGAVNAVAVSPDGTTIASAGDDKTVRLWRGVLWRDVAGLKTTVCDVLLTGVDRLEWAEYVAGIPYRRSCS